MPKVEIRDQLTLTDHWIRVRKTGYSGKRMGRLSRVPISR
jgi:hypothetical protein